MIEEDEKEDDIYNNTYIPDTRAHSTARMAADIPNLIFVFYLIGTTTEQV